MSAQNTHDLPEFYHIFVSFHMVISVIITLYMIFSFLCTSSEKGGIWMLYRDLKKENGEPSSNIVTLRLDVVLVFISPMSQCCYVRDLINEILRYKAEVMSCEGRGERREQRTS